MPYKSADIRNVCLVGPSNAGKTQLTEALLQAGGKISEQGLVEKGNTVSDYTSRERELGHSQYVSVCHLDHGGIHVNLIDTPGYADFVGDVHAAMRVADLAVFVVSAVEGVEVQTEYAWGVAEDHSYRVIPKGQATMQ